VFDNIIFSESLVCLDVQTMSLISIFFINRVAIQSIERKQEFVQICRQSRRSVSRSVGRSVRRVYCGKTADWIWMPFVVVSGIGGGMGVLDEGGDCRREGAVLGVNVGYPIVTNRDFVS